MKLIPLSGQRAIKESNHAVKAQIHLLFYDSMQRYRKPSEWQYFHLLKHTLRQSNVTTFFTPAFLLGRVAWTETLGCIKIPSVFQQPATFMLAPLQDWNKPGRGCNRVIWSSVHLRVAFPWVQPTGLALPIVLAALWPRALTITTWIPYRRSSPSFTNFTAAHFAAKRHAVNFL